MKDDLDAVAMVADAGRLQGVTLAGLAVKDRRLLEMGGGGGGDDDDDAMSW